MLDAEIFNPAVMTKNIAEIDFRKMKRMGFEKIIFD
jgi:predicted HAD superfamily phosphohydrolase YqeG